ncbi:MAG: chemotaxis protein CheC [Candidatus Omnitrophota bacterium]|nr:chemotaxis protein CheC [Candidatus Omnitrophota bacterium]
MIENNSHILSKIQIDALRELSHISVGSAATALSEFIDKPVRMNPTAEIIFNSAEELQMVIGGVPRITVVASDIPEKISGHLVIIFEDEISQAIVNTLLGATLKAGFEMNVDMRISALKEIGQVMFGSYLTAMGHMTSVSLMITPPSYDSGKSSKMLDLTVSRSRKDDIPTICFETFFWVESVPDKIEGYILFIPSPISLKVVLSILGVEKFDYLPSS